MTLVVLAVPPIPSTPVAADCVPSATQDCPSGTSPAVYAVGGAALGYLLYRLLVHKKAAPTPTPYPMTTSRPPGVSYTPTPNPMTTSRPPGETYTPVPTPFPTTTSRPTEAPTYPPPTPYPTPTPTPTPCFIKVTDGWFEPVQASYQDDPIFMLRPVRYTAERAAKDSPPQFHAGLDMVADKASVLMGVDYYYEDNKLKTPVSRKKIIVKGYSTCSTVPKLVKLDFELTGAGGTQSVYKSGLLGQIKTQGALKAPEPFTLTVYATTGVPDVPKTFKFGRGAYTISAIIKDDRDNDLGLPRVTVSGRAVTTIGPQVRLLPVLFVTKTDQFDASATALEQKAKALQFLIPWRLPDLYPLKTGGWPTPDVAKLVRLPLDGIVDRNWAKHSGYDDLAHYTDNLLAALSDKLGAAAVQDHMGRTIVILDDGDFARVNGFGANGVTVSTKVVMTRIGATELTAGHEVGHTLPQFLWSVDQMVSECGKDYHNLPDLPFAHGVEVTHGGETNQRRVVNGNLIGLMQGGDTDRFITQCTYHNLLGALQSQVDPPVTLLRGLIAIGRRGPAAQFEPAYDLESTLEVRHDPKSPYAIVVRGRDGKVLTSYPFWMPFHDDDDRPRVTMPFALRVPQLPDGVRVELRGPNGTLASFDRAAKAPELDVRATRSRLSNVVHVEWKAKSANGAAVVASVASARTNGRFETTVFETSATSADVPADKRGGPAQIRVIVSDGGRSTTKVVTVK